MTELSFLSEYECVYAVLDSQDRTFVIVTELEYWKANNSVQRYSFDGDSIDFLRYCSLQEIKPNVFYGTIPSDVMSVVLGHSPLFYFDEAFIPHAKKYLSSAGGRRYLFSTFTYDGETHIILTDREYWEYYHYAEDVHCRDNEVVSLLRNIGFEEESESDFTGSMDPDDVKFILIQHPKFVWDASFDEFIKECYKD